MRFRLHITTDMIRHQVRNAWAGNKRYPFVLMLEPLYTCNLACIGCAVERHTGKLKDRLPLERCLQAVDESGAPAVSICGGEPTVYPELPELIAGIIARRRHIYLCTNALLLDTKVYGTSAGEGPARPTSAGQGPARPTSAGQGPARPIIPPHRRLTINVHLDGMRETHDMVCAKKGVFDKAVAMIREGKRLGYDVITNTTVFKETDVEEIRELCDLLTEIGVDGILISPGYHYESVERDIFLAREEIQEKFKRVLGLARSYRFTSSPLFLEFAAGLRELSCSPWSTVTYTPLGWKGPCYLIGKKYSESFDEFWQGTDWDYWESRQDDLCQNCAMHSGFEVSALAEARRNPRELARLAAWNLMG